MSNESCPLPPGGSHKDLGSARHGTEHWWNQRVTALALIFLTTYMVWSFFKYVVFGNGYQSADEWLGSPFAATFVVLFLIVGFWHAALGLQVVIEDYVHNESLKFLGITAVKFACTFLVVLGVLSSIKILFWSVLPHAPPAQAPATTAAPLLHAPGL